MRRRNLPERRHCQAGETPGREWDEPVETDQDE